MIPLVRDVAHGQCARLPRWPGFLRRTVWLSAFPWLVLTLFLGGPVRAADDDYAAQRRRMVEQQLWGDWRGIRDAAVREVMAAVPRHEFVPEALRWRAYEDRPLPIGYGQTISQPFIVAFMTEKLQTKSTDRILEVGTGSGYQAAVLSGLVHQVYSIEIVEPLARRAETDLRRLGYLNYKGFPTKVKDEIAAGVSLPFS